MSTRDIYHLRRVVTRNPEFNIAQAAEAAGSDACHQTIVKALKKFGVKSVISAKLPLLTELHIQKRLSFCDAHHDKSLNAWKSWTFSDECSVEPDCAEGVKRYLIRPERRYELDFVTKERQSGGGKLMIWSRISYNCIGPLIFIEKGIDSARYIKY